MDALFKLPTDKTPPDDVKDRGTFAIKAFIEETNHIWRLIAGVYSTVLGNATTDVEVLGEDKTEDFYKKLDRHSAANQLTNKIITELITCRIVDNFQCYVVQLLELVFKNKKETLFAASGGSRGSKVVEIELKALFEFSTIDELFNYLVEKKVSSLTSVVSGDSIDDA